MKGLIGDLSKSSWAIFLGRIWLIYNPNLRKKNVSLILWLIYNLRTDEPSDRWTFGQVNLRTGEPSDRWTFGQMNSHLPCHMNLRTNDMEPFYLPFLWFFYKSASYACKSSWDFSVTPSLKMSWMLRIKGLLLLLILCRSVDLCIELLDQTM